MEERETIADIIAELRETNADLADRIEEAWEHEKCEIEVRAMTAGELTALTILRGMG